MGILHRALLRRALAHLDPAAIVTWSEASLIPDPIPLCAPAHLFPAWFLAYSGDGTVLSWPEVRQSNGEAPKVAEAIIGVVATAVLAAALGAWRAHRRSAFWMRTIKPVTADVVVPTHHHVSVNLGVRNDAERRATIMGALVDFQGGEQRSAEASVVPQGGLKFTTILEPGKNKVILKWKRADHDSTVARLRINVEDQLLPVPSELVEAINEEIARRPKL